jgi:putative transposase
VRNHTITEQTFFHWRSKFGSVTASVPHKLKELEAENLRLEKIVIRRFYMPQLQRKTDNKNNC